MIDEAITEVHPRCGHQQSDRNRLMSCMSHYYSIILHAQPNSMQRTLRTIMSRMSYCYSITPHAALNSLQRTLRTIMSRMSYCCSITPHAALNSLQRTLRTIIVHFGNAGIRSKFLIEINEFIFMPSQSCQYIIRRSILKTLS